MRRNYLSVIRSICCIFKQLITCQQQVEHVLGCTICGPKILKIMIFNFRLSKTRLYWHQMIKIYCLIKFLSFNPDLIIIMIIIIYESKNIDLEPLYLKEPNLVTGIKIQILYYRKATISNNVYIKIYQAYTAHGQQ